MITVLSIMLGGALGGVLRSWVGEVVARHSAGHFPWGTLTVNLTASLLAGIALGVWQASQSELDTLGWGIVIMGLLGGYSTVSTLSLQVVTLWPQHPGMALAYVLISVGGGLVMVAGGHLGSQAVMG